MADYEVKQRAGIGSTSLILIFIVLCLVTFSILSLGNARREEFLSEKNAAAVREYYRADSLAEEFVNQVARALGPVGETPGGGGDVAAAGTAKERVLDAFGEYYREETDTLRTDIAMAAGQALQVELAVDWDSGEYRVLAWNVYNREEYEIDRSVPVWTGGGS